MAQMVRCDICGGLYNQSHLSSHKRLSHGRRKRSPSSPKNDREALEMIVSLYRQLSGESRKEVLNLLAAGDQKKS
jgi:hypothetical protein